MRENAPLGTGVVGCEREGVQFERDQAFLAIEVEKHESWLNAEFEFRSFDLELNEFVYLIAKGSGCRLMWETSSPNASPSRRVCGPLKALQTPGAGKTLGILVVYQGANKSNGEETNLPDDLSPWLREPVYYKARWRHPQVIRRMTCQPKPDGAVARQPPPGLSRLGFGAGGTEIGRNYTKLR